MWKSKIKVQVNTITRSEAWELAGLEADKWHNQDFHPFNNNIDTNNKLALVNLVKFGLLSKTSLADTVRGIYKKWLIDDYLISNKIDLIISMITSLEIAMANHLKKSIVIHPYQISKID